MPDYMCLLYAAESDPETDGERWRQMPIWLELTESLREAGILLSNNALHPVSIATTVRTREGEVALTDGPFAATKETLVGYYLLRCRNLDEALRIAARFPTAAYGSVEVRPVMSEIELAEASAPEVDR
jgi:hypothetical protein